MTMHHAPDLLWRQYDRDPYYIEHARAVLAGKSEPMWNAMDLKGTDTALGEVCGTSSIRMRKTSTMFQDYLMLFATTYCMLLAGRNSQMRYAKFCAVVLHVAVGWEASIANTYAKITAVVFAAVDLVDPCILPKNC